MNHSSHCSCAAIAPARAAAAAACVLVALAAALAHPDLQSATQSSAPLHELAAVPPVQFGAVERALARVNLNARNELVLDSRTADVLAAAGARVALDADAIQRTQFLIGKALAEPAAQELARLFDAYRPYMQAQARSPAGVDAARGLEEEVARFERTTALQDEHFGEAAASRLFGAERALARYIFDLRRIEEDPALNAQQRQAMQQSLAARYEAAPQP